MAFSLFFRYILLVSIINTVLSISSPWTHNWVRKALHSGERDHSLRQGFQSARIAAFNRLIEKYSAHAYEAENEEAEEEIGAVSVAKGIGVAALTIFQGQVDPVVKNGLTKAKGNIRSGFLGAATAGFTQLNGGHAAGDIARARAKKAVHLLEMKMLDPALDVFEDVVLDSYDSLKLIAVDEGLTREDIESALTDASPYNHYLTKRDGKKTSHNSKLTTYVTRAHAQDTLDDVLEDIAAKGVDSLKHVFKNPMIQRELLKVLPPKVVPASRVVSSAALWLTSNLAINKVGGVLKGNVAKTIDNIADHIEDKKKREKLIKKMNKQLVDFSQNYETIDPKLLLVV